MNLSNAEATLKEELNKKFGLDFEYKMIDGHLEAKNEITIKGFDDGIYCQFRLYESGVVSYCFTFDKIEMTGRVMVLVNNFNANFPFLKAYLENGYLRIDHVVYNMRNEDLGEYTSGIMSEIISDKCKKYLTPLTELTHT